MNKILRALMAQRESKLAEARGVTDAAVGRDLSVQEASRIDSLLLEVGRIDANINQEKSKIEKERTAPAMGGHGGGFGEGLRSVPLNARRYADLFPGGASVSAEGFSGHGDFLRTVCSGLADPRLIQAAASGHSEGVGQDGGVMVPTQYVAEMMDESLESEIVRPRANIRPMETNSMFVGGFDTLNHSGAIGGFVGQWLAEGGDMDTQKGLMRSMTLRAGKLGILTSATNELMADAQFFERELFGLVTKAIGWYLDTAFISGDGVAKPRGVLNDPALIVVNKEVGQIADTIVWENLKKMYARLHPASLKNAVWVMNHMAKAQQLGLMQYATTADGSENVNGHWVPALRDDGSGGFTILGIPVVFTEKMKTLGDQGDVMLVDFSQYIVGLRREMTFDKSGHYGFNKDETYFRAILRADGQGRWNGPMTPANGTDTLSWCVTLQAR